MFIVYSQRADSILWFVEDSVKPRIQFEWRLMECDRAQMQRSSGGENKLQ